MTKFTKEQLIEQAQKNVAVLRGAVERIPGASEAAVIHLHLAEITLAALTTGMEQEPVGYFGRFDPDDEDMIDQCGKNIPGAFPLYAAPQLPQPAVGEIAMQNFRAAMEGIGHIRCTLDETFGGMHGTHCEPNVLVECKEICDAIYEAYRKTAPVTPDGWKLVPVELTGAMTNAMTDAILDDLHNVDVWRSVLAAAPQQEVK